MTCMGAGSVSFPPPLRGRVREGGVDNECARQFGSDIIRGTWPAIRTSVLALTVHVLRFSTAQNNPPPQPSPARGEGDVKAAYSLSPSRRPSKIAAGACRVARQSPI